MVRVESPSPIVAIEPDRVIVDSHHHLWANARGEYETPEAFRAEFAAGGHRVVASVYVECGAMNRKDGPVTMRTVGEAEFVARVAQGYETQGQAGICAGFVGEADLTQGESVDELLEALDVASGGRLRGIRGTALWDPDPEVNSGTRPFASRRLLLQDDFRAGFRRLTARGLVYDAWQYFHQLQDVADLADAFPDSVIVVNHCGGLLGVHAYACPETFSHWREAVTEVARRPNVLMKLGGLSAPRNGFAFAAMPEPPAAETLAALWRPYIETCIELFGPSRCMFESNFPPDRVAGRYVQIWNAFKLIAAGYSEPEKAALFSETARGTYRI
jgi:predicted TIM-barrel fold metal-dependent hydrolase